MQKIIDLDSTTHPQAAIKKIDLEHNTVDFAWVGGPYTGDCVVFVEITSLATAEAEIKTALEASLQNTEGP